jgi:trk system potassium uptake protein TrkH
MSFITLYIFIFIIGTIVVVSTGVDIVTGASAVATSLGNVGPGLGHIGPMDNFAQFTDFNKFVFSILMIVGRLEIFTIYALFTRSFWRL